MNGDGAEAVSPEVRAQLEALAAMSDEDIDYSDAPEVTDWSGARQGKYSTRGRRNVSVVLDGDLVRYVEQAQQGSLDDRLNTLLRDWVNRAKQAAE